MTGQNNPMDNSANNASSTNNSNPIGWDPNAIPSFNTPTPADAPTPVNLSEAPAEAQTPFIPAPTPTPLMPSPEQPEMLPVAPIPVNLTEAIPVKTSEATSVEVAPTPIVQNLAPVVANFSESEPTATPLPAVSPMAPSFEEGQAAVFATPSLVSSTGISGFDSQPSVASTPNQPMTEDAIITPRTFEMPTQAPKPATPSFFASAESVPSVSTPPSPVSVVDVRTLMSDVESLRNSGGTEAAGATFTVGDFVSSAAAAAPTPIPVQGEQTAQPETKPKNNKKILIIAGAVGIIVIVIIGVFLSGIFVSKPVADNTPQEIPLDLTPPQIDQEEVIVTPAIKTHTSILVTPADKVEQKAVANLTLTEIKDALFKNEDDQVLVTGALKEVVLAKSAAGYVSFSEFMSVLLPDINNELVKADFEDDFTAVVYQDKKNPMIGFIVATKNDQADADLTPLIESSKSLNNLYVMTPGDQAKDWKEGQVLEKDVRFVAFPGIGAAFEYAWIRDTAGKKFLVVGTSYGAMQEIIKRAGF